jgi:hypothetical protein
VLRRIGVKVIRAPGFKRRLSRMPLAMRTPFK